MVKKVRFLIASCAVLCLLVLPGTTVIRVHMMFSGDHLDYGDDLFSDNGNYAGSIFRSITWSHFQAVNALT